MNILTAEEFLKIKGWYNEECSVNYLMTEFAKLHVEAALKAASENTIVLMVDNCSDHTPYRGECGNCGSYHTYKIPSDEIDKDSILNSYPLENIK
jgi:hypothetical protein